MTKVIAISDLHGHQPQIEECDLLIMAGDFSLNGKLTCWLKALEYIAGLKAKKKIIVGGNHDKQFWDSPPYNNIWPSLWKLPPDTEYLCDTGTEFEGLKIYGMPWTPKFGQWGLMLHRGSPQLKARVDRIPMGLDILITHGPPFGILDENDEGHSCGCEFLRNRVEEAKPRHHFFGHIHEQGGKRLLMKHWGLDPGTWHYNVSYCDELLRPNENRIFAREIGV